MRRRAAAVLLAGAALAPAGEAQPRESTLESLFPRQAALAVDGEGLARLLVPPAVLAECRPDLSDVRIVDGAGNEVPYLVDSGRPPERPLEAVTRFAAPVRDVSRSTVEREGAPDLQREVYRLGVPGDPPDSWELVLITSRANFVRRVRVSQGEAALLDGESVFRLRQPELAKTRLPLPPLGGEELVVELEGEEGFFLEPAFRLERGRTLAGRERLSVDLAIVSERHFADRSELEIERPPGLLPDRLVLATTTPAFSRRVEVWDEGARSATAAVGAATIARVDPAAGLEQLEVELAAVRGDRLRLVVDNGDSPPLAGVRVAAAIQQPALIFAAPEAPGRLLFGGGRAHRPRYDLEGLRPGLPAAGEAAEIGERLFDPRQLAVARLGAAAANPAFDPAPALAFAMRPGGALDTRRYSHRQRLAAEPSAEGLVRVDLGLELLAVARPDLADVRIVDRQGNQRAYLIERQAAVVTRELGLDGPHTDDGVSRYDVALPVAPLALDELVLHTAVPYFDRPFDLEAEPAEGGPRRAVAAGRLARRQGDPRPLRIAVGGARVTALELVVPDGDDAPLSFSRAEGRCPVPRLYFAAPAGEYAIVAGHPGDDPPVYELARVRDVVLAVAAGSAALDDLAPNPDYSASARLVSGKGPQVLLLWAAIILVVAVLAWLTLRLARKEGE